ncbi:MAG: DoxX family membrane protein [Pyrinomonadaceae bacterium]
MVRQILKYILALGFVFAGVNHFLNTDFYMRMMPPYLPANLFLVEFSGVCEIVLGALLLIPKFTRLAAFGIIALLIAVSPANIYMAQHPELFPEFSVIALYLRLPLQLVLIAWASWYTKNNGER